MGFTYRKRSGPLNFSVSKRGVRVSAGTGCGCLFSAALCVVVLAAYGCAREVSQPDVEQPATPIVQAAPQAHPVADTVYITRTGKRYHRQGCSSLSYSGTAISRVDAQARGYTPCKRCGG